MGYSRIIDYEQIYDLYADNKASLAGEESSVRKTALDFIESFKKAMVKGEDSPIGQFGNEIITEFIDKPFSDDPKYFSRVLFAYFNAGQISPIELFNMLLFIECYRAQQFFTKFNINDGVAINLFQSELESKYLFFQIQLERISEDLNTPEGFLNNFILFLTEINKQITSLVNEHDSARQKAREREQIERKKEKRNKQKFRFADNASVKEIPSRHAVYPDDDINFEITDSKESKTQDYVDPMDLRNDAEDDSHAGILDSKESKREDYADAMDGTNEFAGGHYEEFQAPINFNDKASHSEVLRSPEITFPHSPPESPTSSAGTPSVQSPSEVYRSPVSSSSLASNPNSMFPPVPPTPSAKIPAVVSQPTLNWRRLIIGVGITLLVTAAIATPIGLGVSVGLVLLIAGLSFAGVGIASRIVKAVFDHRNRNAESVIAPLATTPRPRILSNAAMRQLTSPTPEAGREIQILDEREVKLSQSPSSIELQSPSSANAEPRVTPSPSPSSTRTPRNG